MTASRLLLRPLVAVALVAVPAAAVLPQWRATIAVGAALALLAAASVGLGAWLARARAATPSPFASVARSSARRTDRPPDLEVLERTLGWGSYSRRDFDHRIRPLLVRLVAFKLQETRGIDLDRDPAAARAALPGSLRWLVEGGDPPARGRAVTTDDLVGMVDEIERISR
jgi:hypothetical protein